MVGGRGLPRHLRGHDPRPGHQAALLPRAAGGGAHPQRHRLQRRREPPPAGAPRTASPAEVESLTALAPPAPSAGQQFQLALPHSVGSEDRLQVKTIWAARAISVLFPQITTIYGYREDPLPWHPNGLAIDVMIPNYHTPEGIELGNQIAGYALANAKRWGINHVIWRQKIYPGVGGGNWMADLGSETADHYDHVHIATDGGGYPSGHETYYIASMTPTPPD